MEATKHRGYEKAQRGSNYPQRSTKASAKLRGLPKDSLEVRQAKTVTWILRHAAESEELELRPDGYARVHDLLDRPKLKNLTFEALQDMVQKDKKTRCSLIQEPDPKSDSSEPIWWIGANQGHSMKAIKLDLQPIRNVSDIPTGLAVHGTNTAAWELIKTQGLKKMSRNHIHMAQSAPGPGVISTGRNFATILIYIDVQKALGAGVQFFLSNNGVVLTEGDGFGSLQPEFFQRVTDGKGKELTGWRSERPLDSRTAGQPVAIIQAGESTFAAEISGEDSNAASSADAAILDVQEEIEKLSL
ncbi:uncharacterized protein PHACADRAFT_104132 [Phanerochaete carnosa HHB-10118-sp]|uniref:2'-phosphotransferase n=1 Tax=Phanerochaete carnosa (strain HHB-10118-sp) TaxID=650164 RepID=K5VVE9_PHACS|nr:uncharacterized protein PHACADRAFT_104132 [Phanerochaete carnosa HHB-10118-sp]EKM50549.1 hypothetical protein PHACADRAFT_104132 [Phanerochaete carnosa HHB-10118-sp]